MAFKDTLNGFAASGGASIAGTGNTLARTTDGGLTWSLVPTFIKTQSQVNTLVYVPQTNLSGGTQTVPLRAVESVPPLIITIDRFACVKTGESIDGKQVKDGTEETITYAFCSELV